MGLPFRRSPRSKCLPFLFSWILFYLFSFSREFSQIRGVACGRYIILGLLLWVLAQKVTLLPPTIYDLRLGRFLKSGTNTDYSFIIFLFHWLEKVNVKLHS